MNLEHVKNFAVRAHWGQMYGSVPYIQHLEEVAEMLKQAGQYCTGHYLTNSEYPEEVIAAAMMHDILEDTEVTFELLSSQFGYEVAALVYAVTDEPGVNRKERKLKTYPKILCNRWAIHIKLADRIANIKHCLTAKDTNLIGMYRKEDKEFREALRTPDVAEKLWGIYSQLITENLK